MFASLGSKVPTKTKKNLEREFLLILLPRLVYSLSLSCGSVKLKISLSPAGDSVVESQEMPKMDARFAESLVRKWQNIKSEALGPDHCFGKLPEVNGFFLI